jgi:predicted nuclease with TOPRIM domain
MSLLYQKHLENKIENLQIDKEILNEEVKELKKERSELEFSVSVLESEVSDLEDTVANLENIEPIVESESIIEWFESPFISDYDKERVREYINRSTKLNSVA